MLAKPVVPSAGSIRHAVLAQLDDGITPSPGSVRSAVADVLTKYIGAIRAGASENAASEAILFDSFKSAYCIALLKDPTLRHVFNPYSEGSGTSIGKPPPHNDPPEDFRELRSPPSRPEEPISRCALTADALTRTFLSIAERRPSDDEVATSLTLTLVTSPEVETFFDLITENEDLPLVACSLVADLTCDFLATIPQSKHALPFEVVRLAVHHAIECANHIIEADLRGDTSEILSNLAAAAATRVTGSIFSGVSLLETNESRDGEKPAHSIDITSFHERDRVSLEVITLGGEREVSRATREELIPQLLRESRLPSEMYWKIHWCRFRSPLVAQNFGAAPGEIHPYAVDGANDASFHATIGTLRTQDVGDGAFLHFPHQALPDLHDRFFEQLDSAYESLKSRDFPREELIDLLTVSYVVLVLAHFPFDGSGRTMEDLLHAMSQGEMTLSNSTYRGLTSPLVELLRPWQEQLKFDAFISALKNIVPEQLSNLEKSGFEISPYALNSKQKQDVFLQELGISDPWIVAREMADQMIDVLSDRNGVMPWYTGSESIRSSIERFTERYPVTPEIRVFIALGFQETFTTTSEENGVILDVLLARARVEGPHEVFFEISDKYPYLLHDPLGRIVVGHITKLLYQAESQPVTTP